MTFQKTVMDSSVTAKRSRAVAAFLLSMALLLSVVAAGWWSVTAAENGGVSCNDLTVKQAPKGGWYVYLKDPSSETQSLKATATEKAVTDYSGIASNEYGWWRIENGRVNFSANGLYANELGYWYVRSGKVKFNYTGVLEGNYYVHRYNGSPLYSDEQGNSQKKPTDSTGSNVKAVSTKKTFWFIKKGRLQTSYTGAKKYSVNGKDGWWRIEGGRVNQNYNGVAKNEYGWWYFKNGRVDFNYTGVAKNDLGWWRIEDGKVNFNYNGVASNEYGTWYLKGGKVDFGYSGAFVLDGYMYVVEKGKVLEVSKLVVKEMSVIRPTVRFNCYGAELSWKAAQAPTGKTVDGYEIYVKNGPMKTWSKVGTVDGKTLSFNHVLNGYADPTQNTRLYDVRAICKNRYGIVTDRSAENRQTEANNYVGGAFDLADPSIVHIEESASQTRLTFKTVPYATSYEVYLGKYGSDGKVAKWSKAGTYKPENPGSGSAALARQGWSKGNQTVTYTNKSGFDIVTVKAVYTEKAANGYPALTLNSSYDCGFRLGQTALQGKKILFMGDSLIVGTPYGPSTLDYSISTRVSEQTGAQTYNAAVGGAVLVSDYPRVINNSIYHNQNVTICDGSYTQIANGSWQGVRDMSDFDIVVLEGGPNDYYQKVSMGTADSDKVSTFYGALNQHLALLKEASRKRVASGRDRIKVVLVDPFYVNELTKKNGLGYTNADFSKAMQTIAQKYDKDPDIDVYLYTGHDTVLNGSNYAYETVDAVHMTAYRYGQMGNHMAMFLKNLKEKDHTVLAKSQPVAAAETTTVPKTEPESTTIQIAEPVSTP